jgi:hypothetical protein
VRTIFVTRRANYLNTTILFWCYYNAKYSSTMYSNDSKYVDSSSDLGSKRDVDGFKYAACSGRYIRGAYPYENVCSWSIF